MACEPSKDSDQPGHLRSLIGAFAVCMKKAWILSYPSSAQRRRWSDWADAQTDLSLRWALSHFVGFVMRLLICSFLQVLQTLHDKFYHSVCSESFFKNCHSVVIKEEIIHILECLCGVAEGSRVDNLDKLFEFLHPLMVESVKLLGKIFKHNCFLLIIII